MINKDLPVILCGDFNESPFDDVRKNLNSSDFNLTDPWFNQQLDECESHHSFKGSREDGARIDWILHDKNKFQCHDIFMNKESFDGVYPSDHFPICATLSAK